MDKATLIAHLKVGAGILGVISASVFLAMAGGGSNLIGILIGSLICWIYLLLTQEYLGSNEAMHQAYYTFYPQPIAYLAMLAWVAVMPLSLVAGLLFILALIIFILVCTHSFVESYTKASGASLFVDKTDFLISVIVFLPLAVIIGAMVKASPFLFYWRA